MAAPMGKLNARPPSVVVGIDGSRWAVDAAKWAIDEAVSRDIPLRLVYAIESFSADSRHAAHELASAETAMRYAFSAVESTGEPVKIEVDIVQRRPVSALLEASRSAAMVCVGSTGLHHATLGRVGSTAAALAAYAPCPVAVVHRAATGTRPQPNSVVAVVNGSPVSDFVLMRGLEEARLRGAPLRVLTVRFGQSGRGADAESHGNQCAQAQLDRRLVQWRRRYPDLDIAAEATDGGMLEYLKSMADFPRLLVVGPAWHGVLGALFGPAGRAVLDYAGSTVLICDAQSRL